MPISSRKTKCRVEKIGDWYYPQIEFQPGVWTVLFIRGTDGSLCYDNEKEATEMLAKMETQGFQRE